MNKIGTQARINLVPRNRGWHARRFSIKVRVECSQSQDLDAYNRSVTGERKGQETWWQFRKGIIRYKRSVRCKETDFQAYSFT